MPQESEANEARLAHGYTNETVLHGEVVRKSYLGPRPKSRHHAELAALTGLHGIFPVPVVVPGPDEELWTKELRGIHGQESIECGEAPRVLYLCGQARRRLSAISPEAVPGLTGTGLVIVHGDFGPQNTLLTQGGDAILAVFDWEFARLGAAVDDLAWAEWIMRTHHPAAVPSLHHLFEGYGARPVWSERHAAMLANCRRCLKFCQEWEDPEAVALWEKRIQATRSFTG